MESIIREGLLASARVKSEMAESGVDSIRMAAERLIRSLKSGGKILLCGNGGSAADSQHIAAELIGRFGMERKAMPAIALTTDTSILTAVSNDYGYEEIFRRQVEALGKAGDVLVGISTSGRSKNVVLAMEKAKALGMTTVALAGSEEGPMTRVADVAIRIPASESARIQEGHIAVGHILCNLVEQHFFGREGE
ncbi:MAG: D-sedoheptulose 7-phosphate isomerase [bacterium]